MDSISLSVIHLSSWHLLFILRLVKSISKDRKSCYQVQIFVGIGRKRMVGESKRKFMKWNVKQKARCSRYWIVQMSKRSQMTHPLQREELGLHVIESNYILCSIIFTGSIISSIVHCGALEASATSQREVDTLARECVILCEHRAAAALRNYSVSFSDKKYPSSLF